MGDGKVEFIEVMEKYPKEFKELLDACLGIIVNTKQALADGFQAIEDISAIGMKSYPAVVTAVQGITGLDDEFKQALPECIKCGGAFGGDVAKVFIKKEEVAPVAPVV